MLTGSGTATTALLEDWLVMELLECRDEVALPALDFLVPFLCRVFLPILNVFQSIDMLCSKRKQTSDLSDFQTLQQLTANLVDCNVTRITGSH